MTLRFARDGNGRTFLSRQYAAYPFHVCKMLYQDDVSPGIGTVYAQSCSGGHYEHDTHSIVLDAEEGAEAHFSTQASTIVHSMTGGTARQNMDIRAARGSFLEVLPDPQILFPSASLVTTTRITAAPDAAVLFSDAFLTHDHTQSDLHPQSYRSEIIVMDEAGRRRAVDRVFLDHQAFSTPSPGVTGRFAAQGTLIVIAPASRFNMAGELPPGITDDPNGVMIGTSLLPAGVGRLFRILAEDGASLRTGMFACWRWTRLALTGHEPAQRRK